MEEDTMASAAEVLRRSVTRLAEAVRSDDRQSVTAEVEVLIDTAVPLIAEGDTEAFGEALPPLQKLFGTTVVGEGEIDRDDGVVGRLGALVTLFTVAAARPGRQSVETLAKEPAAATILRAAADAQRPLSNQELAVAAGYTEETVARTMPRLRNAGLFEAERDWRRKLNRLTATGLALAGRGPRADEATVDFESLIAEALRAHSRPVDVRRVVEGLGAKVVESMDEVASGHVVRSGEENGRPSYQVTLLATESERRKRYTVAHEAAHVALHPELVLAGANRPVPGASAPDLDEERVQAEREAERMAAAILMPEIAVLRAVQSRPTLRQLADTFDVSEDSMEIRVRQLGVLKKVA